MDTTVIASSIVYGRLAMEEYDSVVDVLSPNTYDKAANFTPVGKGSRSQVAQLMIAMPLGRDRLSGSGLHNFLYYYI